VKCEHFFVEKLLHKHCIDVIANQFGLHEIMIVKKNNNVQCFKIYKNICLICLFSLIGFKSYATNSQELIAVTEILPPFQYKQNNGQLTGYSVEVMQRLYAIAGDDVKTQILPWGRAYKTALERPNTIIYSITRSKFREDKFIWGGRLRHENLHVWALSEKNIKPLTKLTDINQFKIALSRQSNAAQYLSSKGINSISSMGNSELPLTLLYLKRVDFVVGSKLSLDSRTASMGLDSDKLTSVFKLNEEDFSMHFAFSKGTLKSTVERYKVAFQLLIRSGELNKLKIKWKINKLKVIQ